jgi:hypothetical protein
MKWKEKSLEIDAKSGAFSVYRRMCCSFASQRMRRNLSAANTIVVDDFEKASRPGRATINSCGQCRCQRCSG